MISSKWLEKYELAKEYYEANGNLLISKNYEVKKGNEYIRLGAWVVVQRNAYKGTCINKLNEEQIKMLEQIGMIWDVNKYKEKNIDSKWLMKYELAKKYYEEHGNLLISKNYEVKKDNKCIKLGNWIVEQRMKYKGNLNSKLSKKQIRLLEEIGMIWDVSLYICENGYKIVNDKWLKNYELAKKYYEEHGNLLIPSNYQIDYDGNIVKLGAWINTQRKKYKGNCGYNLLDSQIKMLEEIGMIWEFSNILEDDWLEKYELAKKYYEEHGNLLVSYNYKVSGENNIFNLGTWLNTQRMRCKGKYQSELSNKQIKLLEDISMVWELREYKKLDKFLQEQYMLYEKGMLSDTKVSKLLETGILVYGDSDEIQKVNTLEYYRKKVSE